VHYKIKIDKDALIDIQEIIDWYNCELQGLGSRFHKQTVIQINALKKNPFIHATRYDVIRCAVVKKFPFMIHYVINESEKTVAVFAVIHTSRNPKIWEARKYN
jgi:hypothetical protein